MHTVFLIVGESGSGKDSLVNKICEEFNYTQLKSYTTRPKRVNEGDTHTFIHSNEVDAFRNDMIAYTQIGEYEYFATKSQLEKAHFYIVDYKGIQYMHSLDIDISDIRFVTIFIHVPKHIREQRALGARKDNEVVFYKRCFNEDIQFKEMLIKGDFDYSVSNIDFNKAYQIFKNIVEIELQNKETINFS